MNPYQRYLPWGVLTLAGIYLVYCAMPARQSSSFDLAKFGNLPVVYNGRVQPLDTLARNTLMIVSGRQTFFEDLPGGGEQRQPAIRWLADLWNMDNLDWRYPIAGRAADHKVIRIENDQVIALLGLKQREGLRYSLNEIQGGFANVARQMEMVEGKDPKTYDLFDEKVLELVKHLRLCQDVATQSTIYVPSEKRGGETFTIAAALAEQRAGHDNPWGYFYSGLEDFYHYNDATKFNTLLNLMYTGLQKNMGTEVSRAEFESFFNRFAPFYNSIVLYIFVFTLACLSWLYWPQTLRQSAFALCILTFVVHTWALIARMYLMDRWGVFVTNLYSSAIFIGWGCVGVGLFLEYVFPNGIGCAVGAVTGALSLIIAHVLSLGGDTLEMLVAVLDTNFWLATHVTCVTFGYTATFIAGFLGIGYVLAGICVPNLSRETTQNFTRMIYGVICFATLLSFTGTVLGGIWADQSWGRFWGWDPKENGALLIVLMNALTLHARWGGMIKSRGLAVLAILGNIVTAWSWFGVNMLGVGLHNYGFMEGAVFWIVAFVVSQLMLAGLGMMEPATVRKFFMDVLALNTPPQQQTQAKATT